MPLLPAEFLKDTAIHHIHDLPKKMALVLYHHLSHHY